MSEEVLLDLASYSRDPYGFALYAFPWGEPGGELEHRQLEAWQVAELCAIRDGFASYQEVFQRAIASGHGIGKSAFVAILILWAMSTHEDTRGVVTANTEKQLLTKTWPELAKWHRLFIGKDFFEITATAIFAKDPAHARTWRIDAIPWSENNPTAFAGLHNQGKRILIIFDEASEIPDVIWDTAEGALSDANTEIVWFAAGNPTSNLYRFRQLASDGKYGKIWTLKHIDSRTVSFTNQTTLAKNIEVHGGEDDDWTRVRVRGLFPLTDFTQLVSTELLNEARSRRAYEPTITDPLIMGVDVARFGDDYTTIYFRWGRSARHIPPTRIRGFDTMAVANVIHRLQQEHQPDAIFIDGGGVGGGVVDRCRQLGLDVFDIQFGSKSDASFDPSMKFLNKRAEMYWAMRRWFEEGGCIDPTENYLYTQFSKIRYKYNLQDKVQIEAKEDYKDQHGISPDDADAFILTFAYQVSARPKMLGHNGGPMMTEHEYNPFDDARIMQ